MIYKNVVFCKCIVSENYNISNSEIGNIKFLKMCVEKCDAGASIENPRC